MAIQTKEQIQLVIEKARKDMFIYGAWTHLKENDKNRKNYLAIKDNKVIYPIFANDFNVTLIKIMNELVKIKFLNEEVIKILKNL